MKGRGSDPDRLKRAALLLCGLALGLCACGRQDLELLVPAEKPDPCLSFVTQQDCKAQASLGCEFQPNLDGCRSDDPACAPGLCRGGDAFVRRAQRSFFLNGEPFRFVGVSSWALLQPQPCGTVPAAKRPAWIQGAYDDLVPSHAKVARFFAFQSSAGATGNDWTLYDDTVNAARRAGIRVLFSLESHDGGCSQGTLRDNTWYSTGYKGVDGTYALSYRDYAEQLARHFRDEPTVLGYVLMQGLGNADPPVLKAFIEDMGQLLHGVAPNQLMSLDLDPGVGGDGLVSFRALEELPVVDFVDIDDYTFNYPPKPLSADLLATLDNLDKPPLIGEGAFLLLADTDEAFQMRADTARARMEQWRGWNFSGALLWAYQPGWGPVSEEFDARPADPILQPGGVLAGAPW